MPGVSKIPLKFAKPPLSTLEPVQPHIGNHAIALKTRIPIMIFPLTFFFSNTIITTNARVANNTSGCFMFPRVTKVTG